MSTLTTPYSITLDTVDDTVKYVDVKQYDNNSRQITITVKNKEENITYDLNRYSVLCKYITPDNRAMIGTLTKNTNGTAVLVLDDNMVYKKGLAKAEIVLMEGTDVLSTMPFFIKIVSSAYDEDAILSNVDFSSFFGTLRRILDDADLIQDALDDVNDLLSKINNITNLLNQWEQKENERNANEQERIQNEIQRIQQLNDLLASINNVQDVLDAYNQIIGILDDLQSDVTILHEEDIADPNDVDDMIALVFDPTYVWSNYYPTGVNTILQSYGLSLSGNVISIVPNGGANNITLPADNDTTYGLSLNGNRLSLVPNGNNEYVDLTDDNTTYGLAIENGNIVLVNGGNTASLPLASLNTNSSSNNSYRLAINGHTLYMYENNDVSNPVSTIIIPDEDNDTKYGLQINNNTLSLVPYDGSNAEVTLPTNSGSGSSGTPTNPDDEP